MSFTGWRGMKDEDDLSNHIMSLSCLQGQCDICNRNQVSSGTEPDNSGTDPLSEEQHNV